MKAKTQFFLLCLFVVLLAVSCKDPHEYRVDKSFTDYLQRFENEGSKRGKSFDFRTSGLIIEFADLSNNTAGLTHYETPVRVEIDKTYWNDITNSAGEDLMKEDLIFHELGHSLLGRAHLNATLDNGDWKSVMCGGTKVNDRSWNINYRGVRRQYYLDELFDTNAVAPDISKTVLTIDTTGYVTDLQRTFDSEAQAIWALVDDSQHKISIDNGRLCFQSKIDKTYLVFANLGTNAVNINSTFSYELTFYFPASTNANQYGLIFGPVPDGSSGINDPVEYFTINNNQRMFMGNRSWYSYFTELDEKSILIAGVNKLKVYKVGSFLYYFINNTYCYSSEIVASSNLNQFGFMVPPQSTLWIDNFRIAHKNSPGSKPSYIKVNQRLNTNLQTVEDVFNHNVKNR